MIELERDGNQPISTVWPISETYRTEVCVVSRALTEIQLNEDR